MLRLASLVFGVTLVGCGKPPSPRAEVTVSGVVLDAAGKPVAWKVVSFTPREPDQRDNAAGTDDKGHFTLKLVPGLYHVTLAEPGRGATGGADVGGVVAADKGGKSTAIHSKYRSPNDTPWRVTIPDGGQTDLKFQIEK